VQAAKAMLKPPPGGASEEAGSGLEEYVQEVVESGDSPGGGRIRPETIAPAGPSQQRVIIIAAAGAVASLILLAILLFVFSGDSRSTAPGSPPRGANGRGSPTTGAAARMQPNFCGVPIRDRVVVYVLDRSSATGEVFGSLKEACYQSIASLGPDQKFQIIFWNNGSDDAFPRLGPVLANAANLHAARRALDSIYAHGQSEVRSALTRALSANPGAIVIATAQGIELDDAFVQTVEQVCSSSRARIHTFALGSGEPPLALKIVAQNTGGEFRTVSARLLREYAE
jgi:hypothetical protein